MAGAAGDGPYCRSVGDLPAGISHIHNPLRSLARGNVGSTSDIDLIVVEDTDKRFLDRLAEVYAAVVPRKGLDVLVYTPEEFEAMSQCSSLVRKAVSEGRVLYAKDPF
jgi:predicted nucleotidyltransferase